MNQSTSTKSPSHFQEEFPLDYTITAKLVSLDDRYMNAPIHITLDYKRLLFKCCACNTVIQLHNPDQVLATWISSHSSCLRLSFTSYSIKKDQAFSGMILNGSKSP
jgi:hypothetical protein